ncbi:MAG: uracil-DNA glycosylase [Nanoarchaeota archaeon]
MDKQHLLEELKERVRADTTLPLRETATTLVFGKGDPEAAVVFIGEAPGRNEDLQGEPFVGAAGKELDTLLSAIGLGLRDVYIANILKYRPPNNRDPNPDEIAAHTPFLVEQIRIIRPRVIATLGNFSTKFVLAGFDVAGMKRIGGITHLHGKPREMKVEDLTFIVVPMYHPAATLYNRALKEELARDFLALSVQLSAGPHRPDNDQSLGRWIQ